MGENQVQEIQTSSAPLASGNDPSRVQEADDLGWCWGGFLLPYLWLAGHGRVSAGLFLMISSAVPFVSFLHILVYPVSAVYLGLCGHALAWRNRPYHSVAQLRESEREWILWGVVINVVVFLGLLLGMIYLRTFFAEMYRGVEEFGW